MLCVRMALVMFEMPLMENIVLYGYLQIQIYEEEEEEEEQEVD